MERISSAALGQNKYCGPTVLAAAAGITTDEAEEIILRDRNNICRFRQGFQGSKLRVRAVHPDEVYDALSEMGFRQSNIQLPLDTRWKPKPPNLYNLMGDLSHNIEEGSFYILHTYGHFSALKKQNGTVYLLDSGYFSGKGMRGQWITRDELVRGKRSQVKNLMRFTR